VEAGTSWFNGTRPIGHFKVLSWNLKFLKYNLFYLRSLKRPKCNNLEILLVFWRQIILFICSLFYDALSVTRTIHRGMKSLLVSDELERICKEVVVA
jgi:hypothetical protein